MIFKLVVKFDQTNSKFDRAVGYEAASWWPCPIYVGNAKWRYIRYIDPKVENQIFPRVGLLSFLTIDNHFEREFLERNGRYANLF